RAAGDEGWAASLVRWSIRDVDLSKVSEREIDRGVIAPDDLIALAAPCLRDRLLDAFESTISRQDIGEREEARLHDRVDATAQAALTRDPACIDREKAKVFRDH